MTEQPYHKYVFDVKNRSFVGDFEKMYANEDKEKYDSWFQEDSAHFVKQLSHLILSYYSFDTILDLGCGKGAFTHLLKKTNNQVIGVDISETAIQKASSRCKEVRFEVRDAFSALNSEKHFDLIVMMEILSYLKD